VILQFVGHEKNFRHHIRILLPSFHYNTKKNHRQIPIRRLLW
jgi:hypothetical protein